MNIGYDERTAAGDYEPPNWLKGTVRNLQVVPGDRQDADNANNNNESKK